MPIAFPDFSLGLHSCGVETKHLPVGQCMGLTSTALTHPNWSLDLGTLSLNRPCQVLCPGLSQPVCSKTMFFLGFQNTEITMSATAFHCNANGGLRLLAAFK